MKVTIYLLTRTNIEAHIFDSKDIDDICDYIGDDKGEYSEMDADDFDDLCRRFLWEQECQQLSLEDTQSLILTESEFENYKILIENNQIKINHGEV